MRRPAAPPEMEFFREQRPSAGEGMLSIDLGGLKLQFSGLDETLAAQLRIRYAPYAGNSVVEDEGVLNRACRRGRCRLFYRSASEAGVESGAVAS